MATKNMKKNSTSVVDSIIQKYSLPACPHVRQGSIPPRPLTLRQAAGLRSESGGQQTGCKQVSKYAQPAKYASSHRCRPATREHASSSLLVPLGRRDTQRTAVPLTYKIMTNN